MGGLVRLGKARQGARDARVTPTPKEARNRALAATGLTNVGAVRELESGEYAVSKTQRDVHVLFEGIAVFLAVPFTAWLALKKSDTLEPWERTALGTMAIGTLAVDGALLISWMRKRKAAKKS